MAKYVYLFGGADLDEGDSIPTLPHRAHEEFLQWIKSLHEKGHFGGSYRLEDQTGTRLAVRGGQVVEGPFMETKEAVGSVCLTEADSLEGAVDLACSCPILALQNAYVEVRVIDGETTTADL